MFFSRIYISDRKRCVLLVKCLGNFGKSFTKILTRSNTTNLAHEILPKSFVGVERLSYLLKSLSRAFNAVKSSRLSAEIVGLFVSVTVSLLAPASFELTFWSSFNPLFTVLFDVVNAAVSFGVTLSTELRLELSVTICLTSINAGTDDLKYNVGVIYHFPSLSA